MKSPIIFVLGIVLVGLGLLFSLQGFGVISGSAMSSTTTWSILGPVIVLAGLTLAVRARPERPRRG